MDCTNPSSKQCRKNQLTKKQKEIELSVNILNIQGFLTILSQLGQSLVKKISWGLGIFCYTIRTLARLNLFRSKATEKKLHNLFYSIFLTLFLLIFLNSLLLIKTEILKNLMKLYLQDTPAITSEEIQKQQEKCLYNLKNPSSLQYENLKECIEITANKEKFQNAAYLLAIATVESRLGKYLVGDKGCSYGIYHINLCVWPEMKDKIGDIREETKFVIWLLRKYGFEDGYITLALNRYNCGGCGVEHTYAQKVKKEVAKLNKIKKVIR